MDDLDVRESVPSQASASRTADNVLHHLSWKKETLWQKDKRERKRRKQIKEGFSSLRKAISALHTRSEERISERKILSRALTFIELMRRENARARQVLDDLKKQKVSLKRQIQILQKRNNLPHLSSNASQAGVGTEKTFKSYWG